MLLAVADFDEFAVAVFINVIMIGLIIMVVVVVVVGVVEVLQMLALKMMISCV